MKNEKIDLYLEKVDQWQAELTRLRQLVLDCGLEEELKWGVPCYTLNGNNVLILGNFKQFCNISFLKGVLMDDPLKIMEKPGENSRIARIIKFTGVEEINSQWDTLRAYIFEAIDIEKKGLKVEKKPESTEDFVEELQQRLESDSDFSEAFNALTPGRQRAYNIYFSGAKQAKTRESRIEKYTERIMNGKGFHDCVCGLSKRMPTCDGSHKKLAKKS
ncbi:MAG: hypothetical protein CML05_13915 [Pseudozobellia sp.]|nr:hypothetical protein [Pseudozobellia sp.]MBG49377.1 hypothetical protein [Pseudozobellia sp.]|tara:strand:+ start:7369 stop:8019 length:651 start_codon:yes stop_codon:yes gene_type:complete